MPDYLETVNVPIVPPPPLVPFAMALAPAATEPAAMEFTGTESALLATLDFMARTAIMHVAAFLARATMESMELVLVLAITLSSGELCANSPALAQQELVTASQESVHLASQITSAFIAHLALA